MLCLIDTSGAYCGLGAEERGQGQAIAENLMEMMTLRTPVLALLIGEGGSGGALALAVADQVWAVSSKSFLPSATKIINSWGWYLAGGIIDLLIGIYLVFYPLVSMELIPFIVAFWLMFRGFTLCGYSTDLKRYGTKDWGWYLVFGILAIFMFHGYHLATGTRSSHCALYAVRYFPHYRLFPYHFLV